MTSNDVLWAEVQSLRDQGLSVRAIGKRLGISRMRAHRLVSAPPPWARDGDDGDGPLWDGDDEESLTPPFLFVGLEVEPRPGKPVRGGERYVDARGRSFNPLDLYRWGEHNATQTTSASTRRLPAIWPARSPRRVW